MRPEGLCQWKIPNDTIRIRTRFVGQCLNQLRHQVPLKVRMEFQNAIYPPSFRDLQGEIFTFSQNWLHSDPCDTQQQQWQTERVRHLTAFVHGLIWRNCWNKTKWIVWNEAWRSDWREESIGENNMVLFNVGIPVSFTYRMAETSVTLWQYWCKYSHSHPFVKRHHSAEWCALNTEHFI